MVEINSTVPESLLFVGTTVQHTLLNDIVVKREMNRSGDTAHRLNSYRAK